MEEHTRISTTRKNAASSAKEHTHQAHAKKTVSDKHQQSHKNLSSPSPNSSLRRSHRTSHSHTFSRSRTVVSTPTNISDITAQTSIPAWKQNLLHYLGPRETWPPQPNSQAFCREGVGPAEESLLVDGVLRSYRFYLPSSESGALPLWLLFPGSDESPQFLLDYTGLQNFTQQNTIPYVAFEALKHGKMTEFNVFADARADPNLENDVAFVRQVLQKFIEMPCLDPLRVHCAGFSNGGRFCMQLASKMSQQIASVATVSGLTYPRPNQALRPMPILAFHGGADGVNPWAGCSATGTSSAIACKEHPTYWTQSVIHEFLAWSKSNGCETPSESDIPWMRIAEHVQQAKLFEGCGLAGSVELVKLEDGDHTWPGSAGAKAAERDDSDLRSGFLGHCNREISTNSMIRDFFAIHTLPPDMPEADIINTDSSNVKISLSNGASRDFQAWLQVVLFGFATSSLLIAASCFFFRRHQPRDSIGHAVSENAVHPAPQVHLADADVGDIAWPMLEPANMVARSMNQAMDNL